MACNCKNKNKGTNIPEQDAFDVYVKHKEGIVLSFNEKELLYNFHNQKYSTMFKTHCGHCMSIIIKNLETLWVNRLN